MKGCTQPEWRSKINGGVAEKLARSAMQVQDARLSPTELGMTTSNQKHPRLSGRTSAKGQNCFDMHESDHEDDVRILLYAMDLRTSDHGARCGVYNETSLPFDPYMI